MKRKRNFGNAFIAVLFFLICKATCGFSTGPSYVQSCIRPVSVNEKGEILCHTRFIENKMGAHRLMKVIYGYGIISGDSLIQYETLIVDGDGIPDEEIARELVEYMDSVFEGCFHPDSLSASGERIAYQYGFTECNVEKYKIDRRISMTEFGKWKGIDVEKIPQKALNGAISHGYEEDVSWHVLYDFGNVVILDNKRIYDDEEEQTGTYFNYPNIWETDGLEENIGFEISNVTGILFLPEKGMGHFYLTEEK